MRDILIHCDIIVCRYGIHTTSEMLKQQGQEVTYFRISFSLKGFHHFAATMLQRYVCHKQTYMDCIQLMKQIRRTRKNETTLKEEDHPFIFHPLWKYVKADILGDTEQYNIEHNNHPTTLYCPRCDKTYPRNKIRFTTKQDYRGPTAGTQHTDLRCGKGHILYRNIDWVS